MSRRTMNGIELLRAVAQQEQYPAGRALHRVLGQRVIERLHATPTRPSARGSPVARRGFQEQVSVSFDMPFTRQGLDELVALCSMSYTPRSGRRLIHPIRQVHFAGDGALLQALALPVRMAADSLRCRQITRLDKSKPTRPLIERYADDDGSFFNILRTLPASYEVVVAVRESEMYDARRQSYRHPLLQMHVPRRTLPGLSEFCPSFLSWRESTASAALEWEGADACRTVSLCLPCCTFEERPSDLRALVLSLP